MAATIRTSQGEATIDGWKWTSENKELATVLNQELDPAGPSGADPDPDGNEARRMAAKFGGEVIRRDKVPYDKDEIY